ncbi:hypothetical protein ONS95_000066 [Cadophora gregata]|uniref:uncharacterized protein n=1 Tax=Cadophora gregata TaxID=51156 RepID=UPI0026DDA442|nr:uncharacterized protein ONS95_000066 [Cadophora gregata]KAK0115666.1 hypothetical protein ONS96_014112 [Cadophora gregata f. sp. sojae]KAK0128082.1 hypothetical protein ONS95_000066 [Cadophora gregata]
MDNDKRPISEVDDPETRRGKKSLPKAIEPEIILARPDGLRDRRWWSLIAAYLSLKEASEESNGRNDSLYSTKLAPISFGVDSSPILCFGMIHNATAKVLNVEDFSQLNIEKACSVPNLSQLYLSFKSDAVIAGISEAQPLAVLSEATSEVLRDLSSMRTCRFTVYVNTDPRIEIPPDKDAKGQKTLSVKLDIVLYGSDEICSSVGIFLSRARIYLQHPCFQEPDTEYNNPHVLDLSQLSAQPGVSEPENAVVEPATNIPSDIAIPAAEEQDTVGAAEVKKKISNVFNSLTRYKSLTRLEADIKVTTPLLPHQQEALDFMMQRELGPVPSQYSIWSRCTRDKETFYENKITGLRTDLVPNETVGGILADDMGLGKTLTVISTILRTANLGKQFQEKGKHTENTAKGDQAAQKRVNSRATLVVVPSPLLIDGWQREIEAHCDGSLNVNVYHGRGREVSPDALADWDIVLSTYHTIAAEMLDEHSPLYNVTWFRIVLDEAHIIRRMSTKLFQSMAKLEGKFRWCLTGTPIQNGLEDLASLAAFIKCFPLDSLPEFRQPHRLPAPERDKRRNTKTPNSSGLDMLTENKKASESPGYH